MFNSNPYIQEVDGVVSRQSSLPKRIILPYTTTSTMAFKLPLGTATGFKINYVFNSTTNNQMRSGTLHLAVDRTNNRVQLVDEYEYLGSSSGENAVIFTATFQTNGGVKVIRVNYTNSNLSDVNTFTYSYSVVS